jgi:hypothetical protein
MHGTSSPAAQRLVNRNHSGPCATYYGESQTLSSSCTSMAQAFEITHRVWCKDLLPRLGYLAWIGLCGESITRPGLKPVTRPGLAWLGSCRWRLSVNPSLHWPYGTSQSSTKTEAGR